MNAQLPPIDDDLAAIRAQLAGISDQLDAIQRTQPAVVITGEHIGFFAWVGILVKIALASIPALIIVAAIIFFSLVLLSVFGIGILGR